MPSAMGLFGIAEILINTERGHEDASWSPARSARIWLSMPDWAGVELGDGPRIRRSASWSASCPAGSGASAP
ncbi:MAG: hypothetical protein MZU91_12025 [Desulfosudis oleivorans]|nr:hypothetical protein [Desulfosudis oleivorans]